ncbi:MAG: hypothetical protein ACR2NN_23795 [Bryobacteraceae bacterium]
MPRKRVKDLLAHTLGPRRNSRPAIQQISVAGLSGLTGSVSSPGSTTQSLLGGLIGGPSTDVGGQVSALSKQLNDLRTVQQTQVDTLNANTRALVQSTLTKTSGTASSSTAGSLLSGIFGSAFSLSPILEGVLSLFRGSSSQTVQPLVPFTLPPSVQYQGGYTASNGGQVASVDYGQSGGPRAATPAPAANVQIQVNAMDSRSFLDHSDDIARAVRQALLHSNSLNDVITDL